MVFTNRETIYTPQSGLRNPRYLFGSLIYDLRHARGLAWQLALRDIRTRYRGSFLGILWSLASPLATTLTFTLLQEQNILNVDSGDIPYPVFVLIGTLLWQLFTASLTSTLDEVRAAMGIMSKINLPREAFLLSSLYKILFDNMLRALPLIALLVLYQVPLEATAPLVIFAVIGLLLLGTTLALILMPFVILIDDLKRIVTMALSFGFFVTPVIYPPTSDGVLGFIASINPVTPLLVTGRELLTETTLSYPNTFLLFLILLVPMLLVGLIIYRLTLPIIIERQSA